jgi:predicted peroxiredoxin
MNPLPRFGTALWVAIPLMVLLGGAGSAAPPHGKLVLMLTTGVEDVREMSLSLQDAKRAKECGCLQDVIWIARDRGVEALGGPHDRPPELIQLARQVKASGVRILVSGPALQRFGIYAKELDPEPDEVVPDAFTRVAQLVSQGYQVIRY